MAETLLSRAGMMFRSWKQWWSRLWLLGVVTSLLPCNLLAATRVVESPTALAIDGRGWFLVMEKHTGEEFFTRQGEFVLDENGYVVTPDGFVLRGVDGFNPTEIRNVRIDSTGMPVTSDPTATVVAFRVERSGDLVVGLSDGSEFVRSRVVLQDFRMPANLLRVQPHLYKGTPEAEPIGSPQPPGSNGLGWLQSNAVELEEVRWTVKGSYQRPDPNARGALTATGLPTDLGIRGEGFFAVRDPATSEIFLTRAGFFLCDGDGFLTTYSGLRVQGFVDASELVMGDVVIDAIGAPETTDPNSVLSGYEILRDGRVWVMRSDGTTYVRARILLRQVEHAERLRFVGDGLYSGVVDAGLLAIDEAESSFGQICQGSAELLHVTQDLLNRRRELEFFQQGTLRRTGNATDLAITGRGFFVVRKPFDYEDSVTRRGRFRVNRDGYLVTPQGERVQGFVNAELMEIGDVKIDDCCKPSSSDPGAKMVGFNIDATGMVEIDLSDGTAYTRAQVLLRDFAQSYSLEALGRALYRGILEARPLETLFAPGTRGLGSIQSGALEVPLRQKRLMLPPASGVQLLITGEPGSSYAVQTRLPSRRWVTIERLKLGATGEADFFDVSKRKLPRSEYRVIAQ